MRFICYLLLLLPSWAMAADLTPDTPAVQTGAATNPELGEDILKVLKGGSTAPATKPNNKSPNNTPLKGIADTGKRILNTSPSGTSPLGGAANSGDEQIFGVATEAGEDIFNNAKPVLQGLALLAILGVGSMAIFGRMPWGWAFGIIGAMCIVLLAGEIKNWIITTAESANGEGFKAVADGVKQTTDDVYTDAQALIYIAAGIAVMGLGILALFGQFSWKWFFATIGGLIIIVLSQDLVEAMMGGSEPGDLSPLYDETSNFAKDTFISVENMVYGIAGLGALGIGTLAYFGRFQWGMLFSLMGGLSVIAGVGLLVNFVVGVNPY